VDNGGILQHIKRHLKVSCLPKDLPNSIEVDVTSLDMGQAMKVQDVILPAGLTAVDHADDAVASVIAVRAALQVAEGEATEGDAAEAAESAEEKKEKAQ